MTKKKQPTEEKGDKKDAPWMLGHDFMRVVLIGVSVVLILIFIVVELLFGFIILSSSGSPLFECHPVSEVHGEYDNYVNQTWLKSNEIRGYEDIPEGVRRNLSEDAKRFLQIRGWVDYTPRHYQNLSEEEKSVFMKTIEKDSIINAETKTTLDGERYLSAHTKLEDDDTIYNNTVYECQKIRGE
ncbi:MAG: hypothetical protein U5J64_10555 [Halobacteriales archaeon]|nr:hypothetical protein [Halobacteriales archaeon]